MSVSISAEIETVFLQNGAEIEKKLFCLKVGIEKISFNSSVSKCCDIFEVCQVSMAKFPAFPAHGDRVLRETYNFSVLGAVSLFVFWGG